MNKPRFVWIIFALVALSLSTAQTFNIQRKNPRVVIVEEKQEWLLALATPVVAKMHAKSPTALLALNPVLHPKETMFVKSLARNCTILTTLKREPKHWKGIAAQIIQVDPDFMKAGIFIAQRFWKKSEELVVANMETPEYVVHGATLAAHLRIPFVPIPSQMSLVFGYSKRKIFLQMLEQMGIKRILVAGKMPSWIASLRMAQELDQQQLERRILQKCGGLQVRHIILTRIVDDRQWRGKSGWLAPYMSVLRQAPLVFCHSENGRDAEEQVFQYINTYKIKPRFLTIMADYATLDSITVKNRDVLGKYTVEIEPCMIPPQGSASSLAIGRIPCFWLRDASMLITRTVFRSYLLRQQDVQVVMIANPSVEEEGGLPLAETVARVTSHEFMNLGFPIEEYYKIPSNNPEVLNAADKAHLVLFQGHASDQFLFIELDHGENGEEMFWQKKAPPRRLKGLPLVVLQSCFSLEDQLAQQIFLSGAVGLVGSVTSIHSASGSSFLKAFCDSLLYRGSTVGEALLDARNYFWCLAQLKSKRGHREIPKVKRVSLSFRLWGDPEMRILPVELTKPIRRPVSAKFTKKRNIRISIPKRRFPKSETEKYFTRIAAGSEVAGLVKRLKKKTERRIMPLYFFRLPWPEQFTVQQYKGIWCREDDSHRAVFLPDCYQQFIYVLYFPKKQLRDEKVLLKFYRKIPKAIKKQRSTKSKSQQAEPLLPNEMIIEDYDTAAEEMWSEGG